MPMMPHDVCVIERRTWSWCGCPGKSYTIPGLRGASSSRSSIEGLLHHAVPVLLLPKLLLHGHLVRSCRRIMTPRRAAGEADDLREELAAVRAATANPPPRGRRSRLTPSAGRDY